MSNEIDLSPYVAFVATGTDREGKRNKPYRSKQYLMVRGQNWWTKSVWGILPSGKRKLLYRVVN